jgi:hypothetical protein
VVSTDGYSRPSSVLERGPLGVLVLADLQRFTGRGGELEIEEVDSLASVVDVHVDGGFGPAQGDGGIPRMEEPVLTAADGVARFADHGDERLRA